MADYDAFNDYMKDAGTASLKISNERENEVIKEEMIIDAETYGISKPKRVVVRARIADDKG